MARAGYDPRDLANMFQTIERQSGGGGGGFLSDHPSPANRYARINQEAQYLRVENPVRDSREFARVQARLRGMGRAPSMRRLRAAVNAIQTAKHGNTETIPTIRRAARVGYPSTRYQSYSEFGGALRVSVPSNWRELGGNNSVLVFS